MILTSWELQPWLALRLYNITSNFCSVDSCRAAADAFIEEPAQQRIFHPLITVLRAMQVALTLAEKVLSPPKQEVKVLDVAEVRSLCLR